MAIQQIIGSVLPGASKNVWTSCTTFCCANELAMPPMRPDIPRVRLCQSLRVVNSLTAIVLSRKGVFFFVRPRKRMLSELVKLIDFHEVYRQGLFLLLQVQTAAEFLQLICQPVFFKLQGPTKHSWHTHTHCYIYIKDCFEKVSSTNTKTASSKHMFDRHWLKGTLATCNTCDYSITHSIHVWYISIHLQ